MKNIKGCSILLKDDFNNVLIIQKGKKRAPENWQIVGRLKKGKETDEKCVHTVIKEALNTLVFDLEVYGEFENEEGQNILVYTGKIKDFMNNGKNVLSSEWISKNHLESYDLDNFSRKVLEDFFK